MGVEGWESKAGSQRLGDEGLESKAGSPRLGVQGWELKAWSQDWESAGGHVKDEVERGNYAGSKEPP